jgi:hypothetical protein
MAFSHFNTQYFGFFWDYLNFNIHSLLKIRSESHFSRFCAVRSSQIHATCTWAWTLFSLLNYGIQLVTLPNWWLFCLNSFGVESWIPLTVFLLITLFKTGSVQFFTLGVNLILEFTKAFYTWTARFFITHIGWKCDILVCTLGLRGTILDLR